MVTSELAAIIVKFSEVKAFVVHQQFEESLKEGA